MRVIIIAIVVTTMIGFFGACTMTGTDTVNELPVADAGTNQTLYVDESVQFDGSSSSDDGSIVSYYWDFGDTFTATEIYPDHSYSVSGDYDVALTVADNDGATDTDTIVITIEDLYVGTWEWIKAPASYQFTFNSGSFELRGYSSGTLIWSAKGTIMPDVGALELDATTTHIKIEPRAWEALGDDWNIIFPDIMTSTNFVLDYSITGNTMTMGDVLNGLNLWIPWGNTGASENFTKI